jgi:hypothetical protein
MPRVQDQASTEETPRLRYQGGFGSTAGPSFLFMSLGASHIDL